jgi:hypothetical protein
VTGRRIASFGIATLAAAGILALAPGAAHAQGSGGRPTAGASAAPTGTQGQGQSLIFNGSVAEIYDDDALAASSGIGNGAPQSSTYTWLSGGLSYSKQTPSGFNFGASGSTSTGYDPKRGELMKADHYARASMTSPIGRKSTLTFGQIVTYTPSYLYRLFPAPVETTLTPEAVTGANYSAANESAYSYDSSASFAHKLSRVGSLNFGSTYRITDFSGQGRDVRSYSLSAGYHHTFTKTATLKLDYGYRKGTYAQVAGERATVAHDLNIGLDYTKALSRSRRTFVSFNSGSTIIQADPLNTTERSQYMVLGGGSLSHQMGRTWLAQLDLSRSLKFLEGFPDPVLSNGVNASLAGQVSKRLNTRFNAGYSTGDVNSASPVLGTNGFNTYTALANVSFRMTRHLSIYSDYFYYYYDMGSGIALPPGVPAGLERNSIHVGLTLWAPLVRR